MPLVQAWQCPKTHKLFPTLKAYKKHLRTEGKRRYQERRHQLETKDFSKRLVEVQDCVSAADIETWVKTHWAMLSRAYNHARGVKSRQAFAANEESRLLSIVIDIHPCLVSLSHSLPLIWNYSDRYEPIPEELIKSGQVKKQKNGVYCWSDGSYYARRYGSLPGWQGNISFIFDSNPKEASAIMRQIGINTGTGGFRGDSYIDEDGTKQKCYRLAYDLRMFEDDWPAMSAWQKLMA